MKVFFYLFLFVGTVNFVSAQTLDWYTNNFTTKLEEGGTALPRADSLKDLGIRVTFEESYLKYDAIWIEIHCDFGNGKDQPVLIKSFIPSSNEFKVKYGEKKAYNFWVLNPNGGRDLKGDFENNHYSYYENRMPTKSNILGHPRNINGFYIIVKGYLKTGVKNYLTDDYGNVVEYDAYDEGTVLATSVSFDLRWKTKSQKK